MPNASAPAPDSPASSAALQRLEQRLAKLPADRLVNPRADVKLAAMAALGVADRIAAPEVRARFARLPREEFEPAHLDDLRDAAWAAWHAKSQLDAALASAGDAPLTAELIERATGLRDRMLRVLRYYFEGDAEVGKQLSPIGRRKGLTELPGDLGRLAKLYRERRATIEADTMHYRAGDADDADAIAAEAEKLSGARRAEAGQRGTELVSRAFTLLAQVYGEVRAAGLYLFRRENASELFPDLNSLQPARGRPRKAASAPGEAPPSEPPPPAKAQAATTAAAPAQS